jgi:hypothetical protein
MLMHNFLHKRQIACPHCSKKDGFLPTKAKRSIFVAQAKHFLSVFTPSSRIFTLFSDNVILYRLLFYVCFCPLFYRKAALLFVCYLPNTLNPEP